MKLLATLLRKVVSIVLVSIGVTLPALTPVTKPVTPAEPPVVSEPKVEVPVVEEPKVEVPVQVPVQKEQVYLKVFVEGNYDTAVKIYKIGEYEKGAKIPEADVKAVLEKEYSEETWHVLIYSPRRLPVFINKSLIWHVP